MRAALLFVLFVSVFTSKVRFDGHKVYRLTVRNETEYNIVNQFAEDHELDVWALNGVEGWMDIMVNDDILDKLPFPKAVTIEDVQASIEESEQDRQLNSNPNDFFSDFQTSGAIHAWIAEQAAANPNKAEQFSLGTTHIGNLITGIRLFKGAAKKKMVIQCGIHAREWIGPSTCCWIINELLKLSSHRLEWMIIPVLNVDGYDYTHTTNRLWRKNRQPNAGSSCIGTDLNRNYGYGWGGPGASPSPCAETYYGSGPFSGVETRRLQTFLNTYIYDETLASYFDIHAYGAMWMSPWGDKSALPLDYPAMNTAMQQAVAAVASVARHNYAYGSVNRVIYAASGGSNDWSYGDGNVVHSYAVECFGSSFTPPVSYIATIGAEVCAGVLRTADFVN